MYDVLFLVALVVVIFAVDIGRRWWRENEWKRHWRRTRQEDD